MSKKLVLRLFLVIGIFAVSLWFSLMKPIKLGLDLKGGAYVVLEAVDDGKTKIDNEAMNRLIEVLNRRINGIGVAESSIQKAGDNRVIIELPGLQNTEDAINLIGKTALMEFKIMNEDGTLGETLLTGSALKKADVSYDNLGRPQISFEMTAEGAQEFAKITRENIGRQLAITLDGVVQTAPKINTEIPSGNGAITGNYSVEEAKGTAALLNAGALPIKAEIVETRTVGATLGDESIAQSKNAGMVAIILIWVFMLIFYRLPGIIADLVIILFGFITFACLNFIDATLTLPGIAGFILSLGMAVDANVIIFERIKEELRFGNTIKNSIESGFNKGFVAIFDSNLTTLIITAILFVFGTGPIKGFAVTLAIGTLASMFTAITATKILLLTFVSMFNFKDPKLFGVSLKEANNEN
ncbi:protein translocase subunit SecD [Fusobacterium massiliense]|uniref:protein translocase subunit SecD n=1 Tax=Fusobacterium massiliense TaxID=1852365 RepID=UPI00093BB2E6|nr:protein translocase subunit SecD [Fusobacterium massiliense]